MATLKIKITSNEEDITYIFLPTESDLLNKLKQYSPEDCLLANKYEL